MNMDLLNSMKSINLKKPQVLLYNIKEDERFAKLRKYLVRSGAAVRTVKSSEYLESLGYLLGIQGFQKNKMFPLGQNFHDEMLVMSGFSSERIDELLDFFKRENLEPVSLKAIVTPYNVTWDSMRLHAELCGERDALR